MNNHAETDLLGPPQERPEAIAIFSVKNTGSKPIRVTVKIDDEPAHVGDFPPDGRPHNLEITKKTTITIEP